MTKQEPVNGKTSDGFHTFDELYAHRNLLFIALMTKNPSISWRSKQHADGTMFRGYFIAGMRLWTGDISYHIPLELWSLLDDQISTLSFAPKWDGHTPEDVLKRLKLMIA